MHKYNYFLWRMLTSCKLCESAGYSWTNWKQCVVFTSSLLAQIQISCSPTLLMDIWGKWHCSWNFQTTSVELGCIANVCWVLFVSAQLVWCNTLGCLGCSGCCRLHRKYQLPILQLLTFSAILTPVKLVWFLGVPPVVLLLTGGMFNCIP